MAKMDKVFSKRLFAWSSLNARNFPWRNETYPYKILVTEKLLQQTTYGHVLRVYETFFKKFPNVQSLAQAEVSDIESTIKRLGFQRQRAKQFKKMASQILVEYEGKVPSNREELLRLSGVGEYVSSAVLCFAFNRDEPIVDMNVRRVVERYFGWRKKDAEIKNNLRKLIPKGGAKQFNWGIIDFSALICSRKPKCKKCFLSDLCFYFNELVKSPKLV